MLFNQGFSGNLQFKYGRIVDSGQPCNNPIESYVGDQYKKLNDVLA